MFESQRYQGVIARAGRGRHRFASRRVLEVNILIIGALIFVGIGIAALQSETGQTANVKRTEQKSARLSDGAFAAPDTIRKPTGGPIATMLRGDGAMVRTAVLEVALPTHILTRATALVAAQRALDGTRPSRGADTPMWSATGARWVPAPHPLAVPSPRRTERPIRRIVPASFGMIVVTDPAENRSVPLVRLDTRTGPSLFWYVTAGLSLVTFASGFWNSRKAHNR